MADRETVQFDIISNINNLTKDLKSNSAYLAALKKQFDDFNKTLNKSGLNLRSFYNAMRSAAQPGLIDQQALAYGELNRKLKKATEYLALQKQLQAAGTFDIKSINSYAFGLELKAQDYRLTKSLNMFMHNNNEENLKAVKLEMQKLDLLKQEQASRARTAKMQSDIANIQAKTNDSQYLKAHTDLRLAQTLGDGGAGLFKIQAGLLANYTLMNTFFSTLSFGKQFVIELDNALYDLQAITATTTAGMEGMRTAIIKVSEGTKFTAVEVADVAKILAQAGFSSKQIEAAIEGVVLLATATGTTLKDAADVATSIISVYKLRAEDMTHVSNVMSEALNKTKLTMDKLSLGIQYAGNIAAASGLTFEETTAILGAMSNAGIKSGSTLGTGLRQVLIELASPTEKFKAQLKAVGLSVSDVDVKSRGFTTVLKTLTNAGFDTSKAFKAFEIRSAAAFAAIQSNPKLIQDLEESFINTNAAVVANEVQMKSLGNTINVLKGNVGLLITDLTRSLVPALKVVFGSLSTFTNLLRETPGLLNLVGLAVISLGTAFAASRVVLLLRNLTTGLISLKAVSLTLQASTAASGLSILGFSRAIVTALTPLGAWTLGLTAAGLALSYFSDDTDNLIDSIETSKTELNSMSETFQETENSISSVEENLSRLTDKFAELEKNPARVRLEVNRLQKQFGDLGLTVKGGLNASITELIQSLRELRGELNKTATAQLDSMLASQSNLFQDQSELAIKQAKGIKAPTTGYYGSDLFGGLKSYTSPNNTLALGNNLSKSLVDTLSKLKSQGLGNDATGLQSAEGALKELEIQVTEQRKKLDTSIAELKSRSKTLSSSEQITLKSYTEQLDKLNEFNTSLTSISGTITTRLAALRDKTTSVIQGTSISEILDKRVNELEQYSSKLSGSNEDPEVLTKEVSAQIESLNTDTQKIIAENIDTVVEEVRKALNRPVSKEEVKAAIENYINPKIAAVTTNMFETVGDKTSEVADAAKGSANSFKSVMDVAKSGFDRLKETYDNINRRFQTINDSYQAVIDQNDNPYSKSYGKYGDVEIEAIKRKQYNNELAKTKERLGQLPNLIKNLDGVIGKNGGANISYDKDGNAIRSSVQANTQLNDLIKERNTLIAEQTTLQAQYNAMMGQTSEEHMTFAEQLDALAAEYSRSSTIQSQWSHDLRANVIAALDSGKESFAGFVETIVTGTATVGDAVRTMASSILSSLLKITTNKLAEQLFGYVIGGLDFSGSASSGIESKAIPGATYLTSATGGYIHMATGGMPGRDSVPALLRPGEYVLRNQAVETIGRQNLDMINALGARKISSASNSATTNSNSNTSNGPSVVNVYVVPADQKPSLTKNDVVVTIAEDLVKGGTTKKLIKSIMVGG